MNAFFATLYCHLKLEKLEKVLKKMHDKKWNKKNLEKKTKTFLQGV